MTAKNQETIANSEAIKSTGDCSCSRDATGPEYPAEMVVIRKDWLYHAAHYMRIGIESQREELARHDTALGRDRPRTKRAAEIMEMDIANGEKAMNRLFDFQNAKD